MSMYNLKDYNGNYSSTAGNVWNHYKVETNDQVLASKDLGNLKAINPGQAAGQLTYSKTVYIAVSLNYLNSFWSFL